MYQVQWLQSALDDLGRLWAQADAFDRQSITDATRTIIDRLSATPFAEGESRSGQRRVAFFPPLAVSFQVELDRQTVTVFHIRLYRRRSS